MDTQLGVLLIGSYVTSSLYLLEVLCVSTYFRHFHFYDGLVLKGAVVLALTVNTLGTAAAGAIVYLYTITHWGDQIFLNSRHLAIPILIILTGASSAITHAYLIFRYWKRTKNGIPVIILGVTLAANIGGTALLEITMITDPSLKHVEDIFRASLIWMSTSLAFEVFNFGFTLVASRQAVRDIRSFGQFFTIFVQTSVPSLTLAAATLILFLLRRQSNLSLAVIMLMGPVYTYTMLHDLCSAVPRQDRDDSSSKSLKQVESGDYKREATPPYSATNFNGRPFISDVSRFLSSSTG
ncbi:hypothetical protein C8J57DRAFT_1315099 [Mycena rebaudengoi]|nr:hypothetical protein C8J57DRAFT_1315099 [Mycena rebaudengoi]